MKNDKIEEHQAAIIDQFTQQAVPFSIQQAHSKESFLNLLLEMSGVGPEDHVLDVACGPGLVACAFAARAKHVTGIDLTPAMIERAQQDPAGEAARQPDLADRQRPAPTLPGRLLFAGDYPVYLSSFHRPPGGVCRNGPGLPPELGGPGGRYRPAAGKTAGLRPCGKWPLPLPYQPPDAGGVWAHGRGTEVKGSENPLRQVGEGTWKPILRPPSPIPATIKKIRRIFREDVGKDELGLGAHWQGNEIYFAYPILILAGRKGT